jgi:hypothetical protein
MGELIIPKPAVQVVCAALVVGLPEVSDDYADAYVGSKRPGPRTGHTGLPSRFIRVTRAGGGMLNRVTDNARVLVECWSDANDCEQFANAARGVIYCSAGDRFATGFIRYVEHEDDGPTDFPDPLVTTHDRWQFVTGVLVSTN